MERVTLARFTPRERKPSHMRRSNIAHIVKATLDDMTYTLCGCGLEAHREMPTDYLTRMCRKCEGVKDAADVGSYREQQRREARIRRVLL